MYFKNKFKKAFTLVELVVVIAVIAILTGASVGAYIGVTDNAKRSNAQVTQTEVKNLWQTFLVSDYDSTKSLSKNAEYFCLEYYPENNGTTNLNYKEISLNTSSISSRVNIKQENKEDTNNGLFIKIESSYPSYFLTNSNGYILETSSISKNENEFKSSIDSSSNISDSDKTIFDSKDDTSDAMEISNITDNEGNVKRGYKYTKVSIDNNIYYVKSGESLVDTDSRTKPSINSTISNVYGYDFEYYLNNSLYDAETKLTPISNEGTLINEVDQNNETLYSYGYVVDEITLFKKVNSFVNDLNLSNYQVSVKQGDNVTWFSSFQSMIDTSKDESKSFNLDSPSSGTYYIFVGNTTLYEDFTLPSGYMIVIDNVLVDTSETSNYANYYDLSSKKDISTIRDYSNDGKTGRLNSNGVTNTKVSGVDNQGANEYGSIKYTFTINEGVTLNLSDNTALDVLSHMSAGNGGGGFKLNTYGVLNNNGVINLNSGSTFRSLGVSNGSGKINALDGSLVYEMFKITDFKGGSISSIYNNNNIFPFSLYYIDNIQCDLYLNYGSDYKFISALYSFSKFYLINFDFISISNGLFTFNSNDTIIRKNVENGVTNITLEKGSLNDAELSFELYVKVKSTSYTFPLNNVNLILKEGTSVNVSKNKIYLLNTSSLNIDKGATLNISNNSCIIDTYVDDNALDATINEATTYAGKSEKGLLFTYKCQKYYLYFYKLLKYYNENTKNIYINGIINGNFYSNLKRVISNTYNMNENDDTKTYKNFIALYNNSVSISSNQKYTDNQDSIKSYWTFPKVTFTSKEVVED